MNAHTKSTIKLAIGILAMILAASYFGPLLDKEQKAIDSHYQTTTTFGLVKIGAAHTAPCTKDIPACVDCATTFNTCWLEVNEYGEADVYGKNVQLPRDGMQ